MKSTAARSAAHRILAPTDHPRISELASTMDTIGFLSPILHDIESTVPPGTSAADGAFIAVVTDDEQFSSELMTFIEHWHPFPLLGLVESSVNFKTCAILDYCSHVAFLPCGENELGFRLAQVAGYPPVTDKADRQWSESIDFLGLNMIGQSPVFLDVLEAIRRVSGSDVAVSIYGETGTGKELVARAVHYLGSRSSGPFIPLNCGSLPDTLLENELFGHERGAFTDAKSSQPGLIEQAEGGTLFLDEVEDLSPKAQASLLRFLQEGEYRPLGSKALKTANVRVVAASNVPFLELKKTSRLRSDLFYRLNVLPVFIPPLRERGDDILLMAEHFLFELRVRYDKPGTYLHPSSQRWIVRNAWPGNIREMENVLHRGFLMASGNAIYPHDMFPQTEAEGTTRTIINPLIDLPFNTAKAAAITAFEKEYLLNVLEKSCGNITRAARHAKKERRALGKLIKKHGL